MDLSDPEPFNMLASSGLSNATVNFDLGAAWNETARSFAVEPATLEIGNVLSAAARLSLDPVAFPVDARRRFFGRIFDWVYVRGVEAVDATAWEVTSSDHNPLLVTFRIR